MRRLTTARIFQLLFLTVFLALFVHTEYRGSDTISAAINSFFRADPLVLVSYLAAARSFTWLLLPAVLTLLFTLLLGRFFCGWICPLGTVLDLVTGRIRKSAPLAILKGNLKYWLLFPLVVAAFFRVNLAGILDPIAILVRALAFFLYPIFGDGVRRGWVELYRLLGERRDYLAPGYNLLKDHLLPFRETFYPLAFLSAAIFLGIVFIERYETRNWCRNLCPLGTLLGLFSRFSLLKRLPVRLCSDCKGCRSLCPTTFDEDLLQADSCILCMKCRQGCPRGRVSFGWGWGEEHRGMELIPERRVLLGGLVSGFFLASSFRFRKPEAQARLLRPPGSGTEQDFLKKCVRCGECMKVCLTGALYPAVSQAGIEGVFTPVVTPRLGYCEYNCNLCGQVCPTAAIPNLPVEQKRRAVIGKAVIDKNHCLPYAKKSNCIVCEEHCPFPEKAIRSELVEEVDPRGRRIKVQRPYVVEDLCNGCGICENVCPLEGKSGIEIFSLKEKTPLKEASLEAPEEPAKEGEGAVTEPADAANPAGKERGEPPGGSTGNSAAGESRKSGTDGWADGENPYR